MAEGVTIRIEAATDAAAVRAVLTEAFGIDDEARLVEVLRSAGALAASLVAETDNQVVGHVALSPVTVEGGTGPWLGLGPVGVAPAAQRRGLGRALVRGAVGAAEALGAAAVFVLGRSSYYASLGFEDAAGGGWRCTYPASPGAFRVRHLAGGPLPPPGIVRYHRAFDAL